MNSNKDENSFLIVGNFPETLVKIISSTLNCEVHQFTTQIKLKTLPGPLDNYVKVC